MEQEEKLISLLKKLKQKDVVRMLAMQGRRDDVYIRYMIN